MITTNAALSVIILLRKILSFIVRAAAVDIGWGRIRIVLKKPP